MHCANLHGVHVLIRWPANDRNAAHATMIELNPVRARIADLSERLTALRGYL